MSPKASLSFSAAIILKSVANGYSYGFDIIDITGLPSGTVYPALRRMEEAGLVGSTWEAEAEAQQEGRPPRKYYEITPTGQAVLQEALARYRYMGRLLPKTARKPRPSAGGE
jgi:DNA-binding PadR family transcriptional regulator